MLKLLNSLSNKLETFAPLEENKVKMYVCGPTVYDNAHLGHARCYITWDVLYRYLKFSGYAVTYCRNVTDVDDKILKKAEERNVSPEAIANEFYISFDNSMKALNCLKPDIEPRATETIDEMISMTEKLIEKGCAYSVDGDVYFEVEKYREYGQLSKQPIADLMAGARVEADSRKKSPLDFALWKKDEKHGYKSPWGLGRPGWHIECSAMSRKFLGEQIDIHVGGADLTFPHHENEIAQSECANDCQFVKYWMHNGFVTINKEKMSKSLGNFFTIDEILKTFDSNTIRFFILTNHYRMPVEFNEEALEGAKTGVNGLIRRPAELIEAGYIDPKLAQKGIGITADCEPDNEAVEAFRAAMDEDLNTSKALAVLFSLVDKIKACGDKTSDEAVKYARTLTYLGGVLGFDFMPKKTAEITLSDEDLALIEQRYHARAEKNWARSDEIRDIFKARGIILKDSKDGTTTWDIE